MEVPESVVFMFGLRPDPDEVFVFRSSQEAQGYLGGYLLSEALARPLAPRSIGKSRPVGYSLVGQVLRLSRAGPLRRVVLVPAELDDLTFQARLDRFAAERDLAVSVEDRIGFAEERMLEMARERGGAPQPPLPGWLVRRMPDSESEE